MTILMKTFSAGFLLLAASMTWADCACFCADGKQVTMCNTVEEAQANTNECFVSEDLICPTATHAAPGSSYEAPETDATNCRDISVWKGNTFEVVQACDVVEAS